MTIDTHTVGCQAVWSLSRILPAPPLVLNSRECRCTGAIIQRYVVSTLLASVACDARESVLYWGFRDGASYRYYTESAS